MSLTRLTSAVDAVERRLAHRHHRHAADRVDARLDQVEDEDVRHEVDRGGGVAQLVQQLAGCAAARPSAARCRSRRRGARARNRPARRARPGSAPRGRFDRRPAARSSKKPAKRTPEHRVVAQALGEPAAEVAGAGDHRRLAHALGGEHARQHQRQQPVRGEQRRAGVASAQASSTRWSNTLERARGPAEQDRAGRRSPPSR